MAPEAFEACVKKRGKVRRISGPNEQFDLGKDEYMNVCFIKGEMHRGEKHKAEIEKEK